MTHHSRDTPQFYLTRAIPSPYLQGKEEHKVFTHLVGDRASDLNDLLTHGGFRRSQSIAYPPGVRSVPCVHFGAGVVVDDFRPSRRMRRIRDLNADLIGERCACHLRHLRSYLDDRHFDGGMADMTVLDYAMMVEDGHTNFKLVEYRAQGRAAASTGAPPLLGVALTDVLSDGLSMVYSFYDPMLVGTFMILNHIARARRMGFAYVCAAGCAIQGRWITKAACTVAGGWVDPVRELRARRSSGRRSAIRRLFFGAMRCAYCALHQSASYGIKSYSSLIFGHNQDRGDQCQAHVSQRGAATGSPSWRGSP